MPIPRYELFCGENTTGLAQHPEGDWVKHDDYVASLERIMIYYSIPAKDREDGKWQEIVDRLK